MKTEGPEITRSRNARAAYNNRARIVSQRVQANRQQRRHEPPPIKSDGESWQAFAERAHVWCQRRDARGSFTRELAAHFAETRRIRRGGARNV
jgi:hypothetical protein